MFVAIGACSLITTPHAPVSAAADEWRSKAAISIDYLTHREYRSSMTVSRLLGVFDGYRSFAVRYDSDGLALNAVMNVPAAPPPEGGYPVLVMSHGNAGNNWAGLSKYYSTDQTSGEYLALLERTPIARYAREGFVVFHPDYRGHGDSETNGQRDGHWQLDRHGNKVVNNAGDEIPRVLDNDGLRFNGWLYSAYYTIDVSNLIAALSSFETRPEGVTLNLDNIFLWGRSLGGDVSARVLTTNRRIKAATLWVPATLSMWDQAHHYHYDSPCCADGISLENLMVELATYNAVFDTGLVTHDLNPANFVDQVQSPVLIQVSIDDTGVRSAWGIQYHYALQEYGVPTELLVYDDDDHVFRGEILERAIQADLAFFRGQM